MKKLIGCALLLAILPLVRAESTEGRISALEEFQRNTKDYNHDFDGRIHEDLNHAEDRIDGRLAEILKTQGAYEARIGAVEKTTNQVEWGGAAVLVAISVATPFLLVGMNRRYGERTTKEKGDADRILYLESTVTRLNAQMSLIVDMGQVMKRDFSSELHHPEHHDQADMLLNKLNADELTPEDKANLLELLRGRETDPTVSRQEQNKARELPKIIEIVDQLAVLSGNTLTTPPADQNKEEKPREKPVDPRPEPRVA